MIAGADWVVKLVMLTLAMASVSTWAILIARYSMFRKAELKIAADEGRLSGLPGLTSGVLECAASEALLRVATEEMANAGDLTDPLSIEAMSERMTARMAVAEAEAVQSMRGGFALLASIGSTSPFIGLFGTVWGIMNSFIGISQTQTTNLAVVAPGIAEALLATAFGLVAAIPAVLIYNILSRRMASFRRRLRLVSVRILCLVSAEADRLRIGSRTAS